MPCLARAEWNGGFLCENGSDSYVNEAWPDSRILPVNVRRDKSCLYWVDGVFFQGGSSKLLTFEATDSSEAGGKAPSQVFCFLHA